MSKLRTSLGWLGLIFLGLVNGILEDLMFITIMVPYTPMSVDLTGELFWIFTVPVAQLMALAVTGTLAWFFLGLSQPHRLALFWAVWVTVRAAFLLRLHNPVGDVLIYLSWISLWCVLIGLAGYRRQQAEKSHGGEV